MNQLAPFRSAAAFPVLVAAAGESAKLRFLEFFTANIRNRNTRRAYAQAVREFLAWREDHRVRSIAAVQPIHVAGYIEELTRERSAPTAKAIATPNVASCSGTTCCSAQRFPVDAANLMPLRICWPYLPDGSFWNGSTTTTFIGVKWRSLRERIVKLCRRAVAAIAISAKPGA